MADIRADLAKFHNDYALARSTLSDALKLLQHEPEFPMLDEMSQTLDSSYKQFGLAMEPAIDYLDRELKEVKAELEKTQAEIAELERRLAEAKIETARPRTVPDAPVLPPVRGADDPDYGLKLANDLLQLIGQGATTHDGPKKRGGSIWEIDSVEWRSLAPTDHATPPPPPPSPAKSKEEKRDPHDDSLGTSTDTRWPH